MLVRMHYCRVVKRVLADGSFEIDRPIAGASYVHLVGIDDAGTGELAGLLCGRTVDIYVIEIRERVVAEVFVDGLSVSKALDG